ncbi:phosphoglucosamine mutase [Candidatus Woesearchaeota archaeon]|nr:phosphoglucosamine mutase [Candidatus Woesearchaeota archaeon]
MEEKRYFGTDGIRGKANVYPMTAEFALRFGQGLARFLKRSENKKEYKVIIGKDTRVSGYMFESALEAGIVSQGVDVLLVGPMPTPAVAHLTKSMNADAGIMISASHNPAEDNGIKVFGSDGYKLPDEIELEIEKEIDGIDHDGNIKIGKARRVNEALGRYIEFAKSSIKSYSLEGLRIVIDCANGAAYNVAPSIFSELGAEIIAVNTEPDGENINKGCGALYPGKISKIIVDNKADFGIALDGDADRIIVCDEKGNILTGDHILAMLAEDLNNKKMLRSNKIVITLMSNLGLKEFLNNKGIDYIETKVGDRYVIEEMKKKSINLGGEQSGHIILSDYVTTGDGIITGLNIAKIIQEYKIPLSQLSDGMQVYPQELINVKVKEKKEINDLKAYALIDESQKELENEGRIIVRYSGTENLCRVMVEAKDEDKARNIAIKIAKSITEEIGI